MNPDSLKALLIDQQLGELSSEASELLDAYLANTPEAETEAAEMRTVLGITERTVNDRAELFRVEDGATRAFSYSMFPGFLRASAFAILFFFAGLVGFIFGHRDTPEAKPSSALLASTEKAPWAQYRLADDSNIALIPNRPNRILTDKK